MLVKVLNACSVNQKHWVFASATTDVGFELVVTDTQTGDVREYSNGVGVAARAIIDTSAFDTCP